MTPGFQPFTRINVFFKEVEKFQYCQKENKLYNKTRILIGSYKTVVYSQVDTMLTIVSDDQLTAFQFPMYQD